MSMSAPILESLEPRDFFSTTVQHIPLNTPLIAPADLAQLEIRNNRLYVTGTRKDDHITITRVNGRPEDFGYEKFVSIYEGGTLRVYGPGDFFAHFSPYIDQPPYRHHVMNVIIDTGKHRYFADANGITDIVVNGGAGNDTIRVGRNVIIDADIRGGIGNDTVEGGQRDDVLRGDNGDDLLIAPYGANNTRLHGGSGVDHALGRFFGGDPVNDGIEKKTYLDY